MGTARFRELPAVHMLLGLPQAQSWLTEHARSDVLGALQDALEDLRMAMRAGDAPDVSEAAVLRRAETKLRRRVAPRLVPVINATGTVLHTNLGRAPLAQEALDAMVSVAKGYSNLEFSLDSGERGHRYEHVEALISELTGAEAAFVVNNNAAAVFLLLHELARDKQVAVSRGELVEIGGSFRVSEVMRQSGAVLVEVGTTNKTHLRDYERAISDGAELVLKVHTSNFRIVGFTHAPGLEELVELAHQYGRPVVEDLGSGSLVDFRARGIGDEPTVRDSVAAGVDVVTFSGDKMLGGAQAGIICGRREYVDRLRKNQLARAVRVDKLTLAALEATLRLYRDEDRAYDRIPTLRMLTRPLMELKREAEELVDRVAAAVRENARCRLAETVSKVGGGALPTEELPSFALAMTLRDLSPDRFAQRLRAVTPPVVARVAREEVIFDVRTVFSWQRDALVEGIRAAIAGSAATDSPDHPD